MMHNKVYPFAALVGQEELKLGLLLNAVNPAVGGILIRGEKGTAKSTAVRGLTALLPEIEVVKGCCFCCDPAKPEELCEYCLQQGDGLIKMTRQVQLVNLPLNVTEDRLVGGMDFGGAIREGRAVLEPGLLADVHRGMLYVDEVNLLDDHIVDLVLDASASGMNVIEREGLSCFHPSRFIFIGTMNPEEGELRPHLLDRFGLCVETEGTAELEDRVQLLIRREAFDEDPAAFLAQYKEQSEQLHKRIVKGRKRLSSVRLSRHMRRFISELSTNNNVAGHRADLVMEQAALALAAFEGENEVKSEHIRRVAPLVLMHRTREAEAPPPPPKPPELPEQEQAEEDREHPDSPKQEGQGEEVFEQEQEQLERAPLPELADNLNRDQNQEEEQKQEEPGENQESENEGGERSGGGQDRVFDVGTPFKVKKITTARDRLARRGSGRRSHSRISRKQGRYIKAGQGVKSNDIALDATIRAAAPFQRSRKGELAVHLKPSDIRCKIREKRIGNLLLFVVDGSGSMGARGRMTASKGAIMSLLLDAYQKRDKVSMVSFRRNEAFVNLPVTASVELAGRLLAEMPVGGRTPLSAGLIKGYEVIRNYLSREPSGRPIVIILTDGKGNVSVGGGKPVEEMLHLARQLRREERAKYIVVDTEEQGMITFDLASRLASALEAEYFTINDLRAEELVNIVRDTQ